MKTNNVILFPSPEETESPAHSVFCVSTAMTLGIEKALILSYLRYALSSKDLYTIDNVGWFRSTNKEWKTIFPYLSIQKTLYILRELQAQNYIVITKFDSHNPAIYKFYALTQKGWDE